jgi:hypothetical protein
MKQNKEAGTDFSCFYMRAALSLYKDGGKKYGNDYKLKECD